MGFTIEQLTKEALRLPAESRALLAEQLFQSLADASDTEIDKLWVAEAIRRRDEVRSGAVRAIPGEQVMAEVRRVVGR